MARVTYPLKVVLTGPVLQGILWETASGVYAIVILGHGGPMYMG